jgi:MSHA biogenesis protein MshJ
MQESMQKIVARIDALTLRERALVFGVTIAVLFAVWELGFMQPLEQRAVVDAKELESISARIESANGSLETQVLQLESVDADGQDQLQRIQLRIDLLNDQLDEYAAEFIDPAEMARVLEGLLEDQHRLRLLSMRNLGAKAVTVADDASKSLFYRHGLEIEFEGTYRACIDYLEAIEALPWRFYWEMLDLNVEEYPANRIRIVVSTLSLEEEWIGA